MTNLTTNSKQKMANRLIEDHNGNNKDELTSLNMKGIEIETHTKVINSQDASKDFEPTPLNAKKLM